MKKTYFFLRHNNDIDHIVPVIYKLTKTYNQPVDVIIYSKKTLLDDYRIQYLQNNFKNINIYYTGYNFSKKQLNILERHTMWKWVNQFFENKHFGGILVFNWTITPFVRYICEQANDKNFIIVSLPHGDSPYISKLKTLNDLNFGTMKSYEQLNIFDYVIVPNQLCYNRYKDIDTNDNVKILGSARYCDEWLQTLRNIPKPVFNPNINKSKKVVMFLRNKGYPIFWDEVNRSIKMINNNIPGVFLVVKHHPRGDTIMDVAHNHYSNVQHVYNEVDSSSLIQWSDVVIDLGTSVVWDAVKQNKPIVVPEYLFANRSVIAEYMPSCEARCRDDLFYMIRDGVMYSSLERKQFIDCMIDVPDRFVLEHYKDFFKEINRYER